MICGVNFFNSLGKEFDICPQGLLKLLGFPARVLYGFFQPGKSKFMKILNIIIKYRLLLGAFFLLLAIVVNIETRFWPSFILYFIALVLVAGHFLFGPMRLIQGYMESGDMEGAQKVIKS